jgi:putative addiction module killer protein
LAFPPDGILLAQDNIYGSSHKATEVREYTDANGKNPFGQWFDDLNAIAAAKVTVALEKLAKGNTSNVEPVGEGVSEYKLDFGPGYRVYFGKDGETLVILVGGGTKKRQSADIKRAKAVWADYKQRKRTNWKKTKKQEK